MRKLWVEECDFQSSDAYVKARLHPYRLLFLQQNNILCLCTLELSFVWSYRLREEIGSSKTYMGTLLTVAKDLCVIAPRNYLISGYILIITQNEQGPC